MTNQDDFAPLLPSSWVAGREAAAKEEPSDRTLAA